MSEETIADILAEMFDFSDKRIEEGRAHAMTSESVGLIVYQLAKRFAAAWKRESAGNAAATREALEAMNNLFERGVICTSYANSAEEIDQIEELYHKVKAALSAPARNCDLARDWLQDLYCKFKPPATVRREMPPEWVDAIMAFCQWLLAPADEGGAK